MSLRVNVLLGLLLLGGGALALGHAQGGRVALLWLIGAGLGVALFHASFGFAGAFRRLLAEGRGAGLRAQMLLLALLIAFFLPALEAGEVLGAPVRGFVFPVGWALLLGAFLFGIGMQMGGGCASGTLYTAGGGAVRMWITLAAFVAGATLAAWQADLWLGWPALPAFSLPATLGLWPALGLSLGVLGLVALASRALEKARHGRVEPLAWRGGDALRGPWPMAWGAVALALLGIATLVAAGRPWAITAAFPLWGSSLVEALGWDDPSFWTYWEDPTRVEAWLRPVWTDRITLMNLGLMAGAFLAAGLAGRAAGWRLPRLREVATAITGGLLLGVGAVLATGCNISAYVAGIASGSLHGWVWIVLALLGNWVGLKLMKIVDNRTHN
ncbi:YeeE/YedE family protein [Roseococcus thiosulfatophilus]|uniref:YeeE/YedE family protein n=1 Tax=Roseococcus thiosulfatophilus TaxID=35813 RepID=UPI001A8D29BE|nr:YeeE/YedE family protein [Roseococcus thiosulfatophilus]